MQGASGGSKEAEYNKAAAQAVATRLWEKQSIDISVLKKELKNRRSLIYFLATDELFSVAVIIITQQFSILF